MVGDGVAGVSPPLPLRKISVDNPGRDAEWHPVFEIQFMNVDIANSGSTKLTFIASIPQCKVMPFSEIEYEIIGIEKPRSEGHSLSHTPWKYSDYEAVDDVAGLREAAA